MITIAQLRPVLDSIAAGVALFRTAVGESEPGTLSGAASANVDALAAIDDRSVQRDLTPVFDSRAALVRASNLYRSLNGALLQRALDRHFGGTHGSLSAFLRASDTRVHENLTKIGFSLDADLVFRGDVIELGTYEEGVGFTPGEMIDPAQYAGAAVEIVNGNPVVGAVNLHVVVLLDDGASQDVINVVMPAGSAAGARVALGATRYRGVVDITAVGALAGDRFVASTVVERNVGL